MPIKGGTLCRARQIITFLTFFNRGFFFSWIFITSRLLISCPTCVRVCLLFPLIPPSLRCAGRRRHRWVLSYLEESSLKWAMVIHQLPLFPLETPWMCAPARSPTGRRSFSRSALLFFSASRHISLSVSLNAVLLLWPLAVFFLFFFSLWGRLFCWLQTFFASYQTLCIQRVTSFLCCALTLFFFHFSFNLPYLFFLTSGWTRCPMTHPSRPATPASCASRTLTPAPTPSRCRTETCSSTPGTSPSWVCHRRSRSSTTG